MKNERLKTSNNVPHENGKECTIVPTRLGDIGGICILNKCLLEDASINFTQKTWDMIVYFQSARDDLPFGWKHNKFMKPVIAEITDEERERCFEELTNKAALKKSSLIEEFGRLYLENKESFNESSFSRCGWNLIHHFDGFCEKIRDTPPTVTILGEITPMVASIASVFLNAKPYVPSCHRGEPCNGCKEVQRLLSIYECDDIHDALSQLKSNLHQSTEQISSPIISVEREDALKNFQDLIPENLTPQGLIDSKFSGQTLCLILAIKKSCTLKPSKLKYGILPKGCQGSKCITCANIQARVAQYSIDDILESIQELENKLHNVDVLTTTIIPINDISNFEKGLKLKIGE
ncbi:Hypothetical protein HVR_LOCUS999 [uncultured virus]|nr:Hypothetical protein HVR_LOCUS999 [uncultured virus]